MKKWMLLLSVFAFCSALFSEETENEQALIAHVCMSIERAEKHLSRLYEDVLQIDGMSSAKVRHFLNNLCSETKHTLSGNRGLEGIYFSCQLI